MTTRIEVGARDSMSCWCCGEPQNGASVVSLGMHPEVTICLGCAHFLDLKAKQRADELNPSPASRLRNVARGGRNLVIRKHWHEKPGIGPVLRWVGKRTP